MTKTVVALAEHFARKDNPVPELEPEWMKVPVAVKRFNVTAPVLRRMCSRGKLEGARRTPHWWRVTEPPMDYETGNQWAIPTDTLERHFDIRIPSVDWTRMLVRVGGVCD